MAVIDREGLFYGERLSKCSDVAQLWWPRFYHASNDYARLEISYETFRDTAMRNIRQKLTKKEFIAIIQEYQANYLLFLYRAGDSLWGQWDTDNSKLPHYKSSASKRSPEPPKEFEEFKREYRKQKADSEVFEVLVNIAKHSAEVVKAEKVPEDSRNISSGVGVGVGIGTGVGIGEAKEKAERISLCTSLASGEDTTQEIAYAHPKLVHLAKSQAPIPAGIERAIWAAVDTHGKDLVLVGTLNLSDAVARWPPGNDRFIPNPLKFYSEFEYLQDPKVWERPEKQGKSYGDNY
jgi:hypothetical protein